MSYALTTNEQVKVFTAVSIALVSMNKAITPARYTEILRCIGLGWEASRIAVHVTK